MARGYTLEFDDVTHFASEGDYDFWTLANFADDRKIKPTVLVIDVTSELGDAQEEHVRVRLLAGYNYSGGGTATTPRPYDPNDTAAAAAIYEYEKPNASAQGTGVNVLSDGFNVRLGYRRLLPEHVYGQSLHTTMHVRQMGAVTDDVSVNSTLAFVETPFL